MTSRREYFAIFGLLLALLGLTVAMAHVPLGHLSVAVALSIALIKAELVVSYFMHARDTGPLIRLVAAGATVWLAILIVFVLSDYATRI